jgi:hypothetical protein
MPKIRKGGAAEMGTLHGVAVHCARGSGATTLGCPMHTRKGGATPQAGLRVGHKFLVAFSDPRTTQTRYFLLLFFSNFTKLIQINSNNFSFANVSTPPSVQHLVHVC